MGKDTNIEWTDHTFSPWWGCTKVSPGCTNCYADSFSKRVGHGKRLPTIWGPKSERRFFGAKHWAEPLQWARAAEREGVRRRVFCASMADVFEDRPDLADARARLCRVVTETPSLDWLLLTKRPQNVVRLWPDFGFTPNVWIGTTVEDQRRADERIPELLTIPARVRFLSCEPLLEAVDLFAFLKTPLRDRCLAELRSPEMPGIDWVIVGGESGHGARPFNLAWARALRDRCRAASVAFFCKQFGAAASDPVNGIAGRALKVPAEAAQLVSLRLKDRKGGDWGEWPTDLRVREFPEVRP